MHRSGLHARRSGTSADVPTCRPFSDILRSREYAAGRRESDWYACILSWFLSYGPSSHRRRSSPSGFAYGAKKSRRRSRIKKVAKGGQRRPEGSRTPERDPIALLRGATVPLVRSPLEMSLNDL